MPGSRNSQGSPLGRDDWAAAARLAEGCPVFVPDVEEEQIADEPVSCYNCRYRRWTADAVTCMAPNR